jgi:hypothetical protein
MSRNYPLFELPHLRRLPLSVWWLKEQRTGGAVVLGGNHDPLFPFTWFACRYLVVVVKTDHVRYLRSIECDARISSFRYVFDYDEPAPMHECGGVVA